MFGFNRIEQLTAHRMTQSTYCVERLIAVQLTEMVMSIDRQGVSCYADKPETLYGQ